MSYGQWGPPPPQNSSNATVALVLGICGFVVCPLVCSILAIVFAKKAYTEIDYSGGRIGGRGMAQAGLILGWIGVGLCASACCSSSPTSCSVAILVERTLRDDASSR